MAQAGDKASDCGTQWEHAPRCEVGVATSPELTSSLASYVHVDLQ